MERLVQEPRKKERKVKPGRVEKGRGGRKEELKSWQRGFSFLYKHAAS